MESVCLVVAILDLYIVGVNRRNWGLALIRGERVKYINIMRGNQSVSQSVSQCNPFIFCKHFLLGCNLLTLSTLHIPLNLMVLQQSVMSRSD